MQKFVICVILISLLFYSFNCLAQNKAIDTIVHILENKSIYRDDVNWQKLKKELKKNKQFTALDSVNRVKASIQYLYTKLKDRHGFYFDKGQTFKGHFSQIFSKQDSSLLNFAMDERYSLNTTIIDGKYAYICIPSPSIPSSLFDKEAEAVKLLSLMGKQLQQQYLSVLNKNIEGVIVDFRLSMGGAYPIIITSLAPILNEGKLFNFEDADSHVSAVVKMVNGNLYENERLIAKTDYNGQNFKLKIALLLGPLTSSAAEQSAIAFKGQDNVKYIGEKTSGFLTMTSLYKFSDNNYFTYSSKVLRSNDNNVYKNFIVPDIEIKTADNFENLKSDGKVLEALMWFKSKK